MFLSAEVWYTFVPFSDASSPPDVPCGDSVWQQAPESGEIVYSRSCFCILMASENKTLSRLFVTARMSGMLESDYRRAILEITVLETVGLTLAPLTAQLTPVSTIVGTTAVLVTIATALVFLCNHRAERQRFKTMR